MTIVIRSPDAYDHRATSRRHPLRSLPTRDTFLGSSPASAGVELHSRHPERLTAVQSRSGALAATPAAVARRASCRSVFTAVRRGVPRIHSEERGGRPSSVVHCCSRLIISASSHFCRAGWRSRLGAAGARFQVLKRRRTVEVAGCSRVPTIQSGARGCSRLLSAFTRQPPLIWNIARCVIATRPQLGRAD